MRTERAPVAFTLLAYTTANAREPWCSVLLCWLQIGAWGDLAGRRLGMTMDWAAGLVRFTEIAWPPSETYVYSSDDGSKRFG